jgi:pyruvate kinase
MKHTKIVTTIGPATETEEMIEKLALSGMNVVRLNFSHNEHAWHKGIIDRARKVSKKLGQSIGVLADMQGPRIRVELVGEPISFLRGAKIAVGYKENKGAVPEDADMPAIFLDTPNILENIVLGHTLLIEDGLIELRVIEVKGGYIVTEAQTPGLIKNRKGVNLPDTSFYLDKNQ